MASVFKVHEAKTHLSKLIARALAGEDVTIARGDTPVIKLVPIGAKPKREFGSLRGVIKLDDSFFDPLPEEELRAWEGHED